MFFGEISKISVLFGKKKKKKKKKTHLELCSTLNMKTAPLIRPLLANTKGGLKSGILSYAGIIFWRDFAIFSHFFCKKSHQNSRSEKKNRTLIFSHFAPLSSYFAHAVHFETIGLFCLTGF